MVKEDAGAGTNGSGSGGTGTKRRKMADLRAFVETRILSRSDHRMLDKTDNNKSNVTVRAASPPKTLLTTPEIVINQSINPSRNLRVNQIILF